MLPDQAPSGVLALGKQAAGLPHAQEIMTPNSVPDNRRRQARVPVLFPATVTGAMGTAAGTVLDLSVNGCRLKSAQALPPGKLLLLRMEVGDPAGMLRIDGAVVRWSRGSEFGVQFLHSRTVERDQLQRVLQKL